MSHMWGGNGVETEKQSWQKMLLSAFVVRAGSRRQWRKIPDTDLEVVEAATYYFSLCFFFHNKYQYKLIVWYSIQF